MNLTGELQKLQELHKSGALTDAEYEQAKAILLNHPPAQLSNHSTPHVHDNQNLLGQAANKWVNYSIVMSIVVLIIGALFFFGFFLPQWNEMSKLQNEFHKDFNQKQKEFDQDFNQKQQMFDDAFKNSAQDKEEFLRKHGFDR